MCKSLIRLVHTLIPSSSLSIIIPSPSRILKDVPQDGVRDAAVVVAHADVRAPDLILLRDLADALDDAMFTHWLVHLKVAPQTYVLRHDGIH